MKARHEQRRRFLTQAIDDQLRVEVRESQPIFLSGPLNCTSLYCTISLTFRRLQHSTPLSQSDMVTLTMTLVSLSATGSQVQNHFPICIEISGLLQLLSPIDTSHHEDHSSPDPSRGYRQRQCIWSKTLLHDKIVRPFFLDACQNSQKTTQRKYCYEIQNGTTTELILER